MIINLQDIAKRDPALAGHMVYLLAAAIALGGAWGGQIFGDLYPCPLCLEQREPWYAGVMISAIVLAVPFFAPGGLVWRMRGLVPMMALLVYGSYKSIEHIGVEHGWWGSSCVTAQQSEGAQTIEELMSGLTTDFAIPCDAIQWDFLGITLAGYNLLLQVLALLAVGWFFWQAVKAERT